MMYSPLPRALGCLAVIGMLQFNSVNAQTCPGGGPLLQQTYNTTIVGDANDSYTLSQFDPTIGTLYSAELRATLYFRYFYTLTNTGTGPENYTVNVSREDSIYAYSPSNPVPLAIFGDYYFRQTKYSVGSGTGVPVGVNDIVNNIGINPRTYTHLFDQSVVPFLGTDSLYLNYRTITEAITTNNNPFVSLTNAFTYDSILFRIIYRYCPTSTLPSTLLNLSSKLQSSDVVLSWTSEDRYTEGWFEILKSTDGRSYSSINRQPVNKNQTAAYNLLYKPVSKDGSKAFFRVKQTDKNGNVIYSRIVTVNLPKTDNNSNTVLEQSNILTVFPTVAAGGFVNLALPKGNTNDEWQLNVLSLSGQVLQSTVIKGDGQVKLPFNNPLPNGMHIISATNKRTNISYKGKIIVQH